MLVGNGVAFGLRFGVGEPDIGHRLLAQGVELLLDLPRLDRVAGRERLPRLQSSDETVQTGNGAREHRMRSTRHRRIALLQGEQALLKQFGRGRDQRESACPVYPAQRVARAHHFRRRPLVGIELKHRQLVRQRGKVQVGFLDED